MSALRPYVDDRARDALDAIDLPISVTIAVRDRDARLLDFRLELVNIAAARWAGLERNAIVGRLATELIPAMRPVGLFDELDRVVATGRPFRHTGHYEGRVEAGHEFSATFALFAMRHGDGYVSAWSELPPDGRAMVDVEAALERARASVQLVRLEASTNSPGLRAASPSAT